MVNANYITAKTTFGPRKLRQYCDSMLAPGERQRERMAKQANKNRRIAQSKRKSR